MPKAKVHQTTVWNGKEQPPTRPAWTDSSGTNSGLTDARLQSFLWVTHFKTHFSGTSGWHTESQLLSQNPISLPMNYDQICWFLNQTVNPVIAIISLKKKERSARNSGFKNLFSCKVGSFARSSWLDHLPGPPGPPLSYFKSWYPYPFHRAGTIQAKLSLWPFKETKKQSTI